VLKKALLLEAAGISRRLELFENRADERVVRVIGIRHGGSRSMARKSIGVLTVA
jgi:hypothetical protein